MGYPYPYFCLCAFLGALEPRITKPGLRARKQWVRGFRLQHPLSWTEPNTDLYDRGSLFLAIRNKGTLELQKCKRVLSGT